jgi:hypothetical protein
MSERISKERITKAILARLEACRRYPDYNITLANDARQAADAVMPLIESMTSTHSRESTS